MCTQAHLTLSTTVGSRGWHEGPATAQAQAQEFAVLGETLND
jgi:hypothetical protein